jgi:hypothetical protein
MAYPAIPPTTDATVAMAAKRSDFLMAPRHRAMRSGSGGMGKKEASAAERIPSAAGPEGVSAQ